MAESELEEARKELERLQAKKQKVAAAKERPPFYEKYSSYSPEVWLSTTGEIMNARAITPKEGVDKPLPRTGEHGALEHWRRGLVGCVQDWAAGSLHNVAVLLVRLVNHFKVTAPGPCLAAACVVSCLGCA